MVAGLVLRFALGFLIAMPLRVALVFLIVLLSTPRSPRLVTLEVEWRAAAFVYWSCGTQEFFASWFGQRLLTRARKEQVVKELQERALKFL